MSRRRRRAVCSKAYRDFVPEKLCGRCKARPVLPGMERCEVCMQAELAERDISGEDTVAPDAGRAGM